MKNPFKRSHVQLDVPLAASEPVVIVSGLPRSGTSMMMKMLAAGGISPLKDDLRKSDFDNPMGYYEFERVKQLEKGDNEWLSLARGKVVKVISFLLKYLPSDEMYQVIFLRRSVEEILASQHKMLINRGEESDLLVENQMAEIFEKHLHQVDLWLRQQPNVELLYVHYSEIMSNPRPELVRLQRFLGRNLDLEAMAEMIDPALYRNRRAVAV